MSIQVVSPKRKSLEEAEAVLATQMAELHQKQAELKAITDKLNGLKDDLANKQEEKRVNGWRILSFMTHTSTCSSYLVYL